MGEDLRSCVSHQEAPPGGWGRRGWRGRTSLPVPSVLTHTVPPGGRCHFHKQFLYLENRLLSIRRRVCASEGNRAPQSQRFGETENIWVSALRALRRGRLRRKLRRGRSVIGWCEILSLCYSEVQHEVSKMVKMRLPVAGGEETGCRGTSVPCLLTVHSTGVGVAI